MGDVRRLPLTTFLPDAEGQANYVEQIARDIRNGEIVLSRAVFVFEGTNGKVHSLPFGGPCTWMELVGLLEYAKLSAATN